MQNPNNILAFGEIEEKIYQGSHDSIPEMASLKINSGLKHNNYCTFTRHIWKRRDEVIR